MSYPTVSPYLLYEDAAAAVAFLVSAFGFTERMRIEEDGVVGHAELEIGDGLVMLGQPGDGFRGPKNSGVFHLYVHVYVPDVDAHHAAAVAAGAEVVSPPEDQPYGDRRYVALDPEGHHWTFATQLA